MRTASSCRSPRETSFAESWVRRRSADIASGDSSRMISWYSSRAKVFAICSEARFTASRPLNPKRASMSSSVALIRSACCLPSELAFRESRRLSAACCAACRTRPLSSSRSFASIVSNAGCAACPAAFATARRISHLGWCARATSLSATSSSLGSPTIAVRIQISAADIASRTADQSGESSATRNARSSDNSSMSISSLSPKKGFTTAFQDPLDLNLALVNGASFLQSGVLPVGGKHEHSLCLAEHWDVWIVGDEDHLAAAFDTLQRLDDRVEDKCIVKIVFGLIDQKGPFALRQQDRQDRGAPLARRQLRRLLECASVEQLDARSIVEINCLDGVVRAARPEGVDDLSCPFII